VPVMNGPDRVTLVATLEQWAHNARAGVKCTSDVPGPIIALLKAPSDKPDTPGGP